MAPFIPLVIKFCTTKNLIKFNILFFHLFPYPRTLKLKFSLKINKMSERDAIIQLYLAGKSNPQIVKLSKALNRLFAIQ